MPRPRPSQLAITFGTELERVSRLYAALRHINQAITRGLPRDALFARVCEVLVEDGGFGLAWVGWREPGTDVLAPLAVHNDPEGYVRSITIRTDDTPEGQGPAGRAYRTGRIQVCNDLQADPTTRPWRAEMTRRGFRSMAAIPICQRGECAGMLAVYADRVDVFRADELGLLEEVAADLAFGLDALERAEVAARERRFSDDVIAALPGVLYLYTTEGRFLRWNEQFERVTGYTGAEIAGMHPLEFFRGDDRARVAARIGEVFTAGTATVTAEFVAKDGTATPYFFTGRQIEFDGRTCLIGVGVDIADRHRAELALRELAGTLEKKVAERTRDLERAREQAESADRLKSAFLATMSHELRTPLNSILGFTGLLLQGLAGPLNPEQDKQLGMVRASARHLLELINDVLDISKIEAGQLEIRVAPFDLRAAIAHVVATVRPLADKHGLALALELPTASPAEFPSDRRRVEQIVLNLVTNAIKFTERGGVTVALEVDDHAARVRVTDTGIGIAAADLARLFQPFHQLDIGIERAREGTGLGLAICRRLAGLLGGEIAVASEVGRGSTFTLTLPRGGAA